MSSVRFGTLLTCWVLLLVATRSLAQQAPADFKVDLVYQVPDIEHPSAVACDAEGNLFVGEDPMDMRGPSTQPIDRIVLIRWDEDGDSPVKTLFCENLSAVFGMVWHQGALYVMNAPYYTMLKDTDGDGIADVRERLADSFGHAPGLFGLNNHIPSGMRLGLDGFVYVALGDKGLPKAVGVDGSTIRLEGGGVFRMRPDATKLEVVSRGIRNNMDVALDRFDNIFAFDNDDDFGWRTRIIHHVPTGYYGYPYDYRSHRNPFLPPVGEFGSGVACGGACYREVAWPAKYQGGLFFCDWGERKIEHYTLTKKGASFEAQVEDFLVGDGSGDFRPIDLCFSPDGEHMYVADWNFAGGGKAEKVGRLFRVTYVGDDVRREPHRAKDADPLEAQIRSLGHPSHHERMRAQQRLAAMGKAAVGPVSQLLASDARALANVHAIWTQNALMDELEGYDPVPEWIAALRASDADVRGQAARALGNRRVKRASAKLAESLKDRDAAVRMQAAVALGRIGQASSAKPLYESLGEQDVVTRFTMTQAIRAIGNWQPALGHLRTADKKMRQTIIQTLAGIFDAGAVDVLNQWFREADDPAERVAALQALAKVHRKAAPYTGGWWGGKAAGGKPARPQEHPWTATAVVLEAIDAGLQHGLPQVRLAALEALREVPAPEILPQVRRMVDDDPDQDVRLQAIRILARLKDATSVPPPSRLATNKETSNPSRQEAIRAVVDTDAKPDDKQLAEIAVAEESPIPLVAKLEPAAYAQYAIDHRGDPRRGQKLFADTEGIGCVKCHVVGGAGAANIGPDLLGVGAKYPRRELIRSVLEPSNRILTDFEIVVVITTDGVIHQGMIRSQTPERTELVTPDGKVIPIPASEIELKETSNLSPMPNGLASGMTLQNFADIIAYLESLKQPSPPKAE